MLHSKIERIMEHLALIGEDVSPVSNAKVVSCVYFRKKIISIGISQYKTHPFQYEYSKNEHAIFLHAEVDAINKARFRITEKEMKNATLFVCRVKIDAGTRINTYGISKPCEGCEKCIRAYGVKNVYYTNTTVDGTLSYTHERY